MYITHSTRSGEKPTATMSAGYVSVRFSYDSSLLSLPDEALDMILAIMPLLDDDAIGRIGGMATAIDAERHAEPFEHEHEDPEHEAYIEALIASEPQEVES